MLTNDEEDHEPNNFLYQGKEWQTQLALNLYDFHARQYDPATGRFLGVYPKADKFAAWSVYAGMGNNPMMMVDPDGEFAFLAAAITASIKTIAYAAAAFGTINLAVQAHNGEIDNFSDGLRAFASGAVAGATVATGIKLGLGVPYLRTVIKGAAIVHGGSTAVSTLVGLGDGIFNGDWDRLNNTGKLFLGNFYLDGNRSFLGQTLQGIGRFTWELPQNSLGHGYSQVRNSVGGVDRVDFFGGATFATNENQDIRNGVSIGNFINMNIFDEITGSFEDRVLSDPLFMHEYGHTFDSQIFGPFYLPVIGLPSLISAGSSSQVDGEPRGVSDHKFRWYERNANKHAARYFKKHYGIDWYSSYKGYDYETFFPRYNR